MFGSLSLKIIDEYGKEVQPNELTEIGRAMIRGEAKQLDSDLLDLDREERANMQVIARRCLEK